MFIAEDLPQFKKLFVSKLKSMLSPDELGAFILVLANSHQDAYLKSELDQDLKDTFVALKNNFSELKKNAPQDDVEVFEQLLQIEIDDIPAWQYKNAGEWEVVCNSMRALRPARESAQILDSIKQPYDETRFHFNKPFLKPEILWEGEFNGVTSRVLFNKFPFSDYHLLIVISPENNSPQLLTQDAHQHACSLVAELADVFPGFGIGFNSLAAGASVNHFHFQGFVREPNFAIEKNQWLHNEGNKAYPLEVKRFADSKLSWAYIEQLIGDDVAFNCLYRSKFCYVIPRQYQGTVALPEWLAGAGWIDVAGVITVPDEGLFESIEESAITQSLAELPN